MKAALYVRVSTEEQAEEGFSISAQLNQLTEYCKRNNVDIYKTYADEGVSAKYSDESKRPQFEQMLHDAEKKMFDIILVHKYDRFARNVELSQKVKRQLKKAGVNVISMSEPIENSPIGFFQEGILELLAEYYIRNLAQESKKGHVERARQGLHNGSVPYGYRIDKLTGDMVIVPEQAKVVRDIFDMYVNQGYGSTKIAKLLNWSEIPTAVNGEWAHYTVNHILKNVKYIGKIEYDGQVYDGKHEPIIDTETFELTRRYLTERLWKREYRGYNYDKFLFLGLIRCGECGKVFRVQPCKFSNKHPELRRYYYMCNAAGHTDKIPCTFRKMFPIKELENDIINGLKEYMAGTSIKSTIRRKTDPNDVISERRNKITVELERAKQAYLTGVFSLNEYAAIRQRLESEQNTLPDPASAIDNNTEMRAKIKTLWDKFECAETIPEKKSILKSFIERINIYKTNQIEYIFYL